MREKLIKSINRVVDELQCLGAGNIADGIIADIPEISDINLDKAEQQLFGWSCAHQGERLPALVRGMGMSKQEWDRLKSSGSVDYLTDSAKDEIDELFGA